MKKNIEENTLKGKFDILIDAIEKEEKAFKNVEIAHFFYTVKENIKLWKLKVMTLQETLDAEKKRSR